MRAWTAKLEMNRIVKTFCFIFSLSVSKSAQKQGVGWVSVECLFQTWIFGTRMTVAVSLEVFPLGPIVEGGIFNGAARKFPNQRKTGECV